VLNLGSNYIPIWFAILSAVFLVLSATRGTLPAKKTWRRIGITFAVVALLIVAIRSR
jgi:hypothetical protein